MNLSIQQSFFGRNYQHRNINPFLKRFIRRNASAIIQFCQKYAKRIKPRHQYQSILFPRGYEDEPSEEISQELINHYHKEASYPFYLSRCNLFIDNHHLKIMRKANPIPLKFDSLGCGRLDWFAEMVQEKQKDFLIGVTSQNWVLIISLVQRNFNKYMIPDSSSRSNKEIVSLNCHKSYIFIFCADQFHILENKNGLKRGSKLDLVYAKQNNFKIHKGYGIEYNGKIYIFHISQNKAKILISQEGILSKIDFKEVVLYQTVYQSNFINFSLNLKDNLVTFLVATRQEVNILNYHLKNQTINILFRKQNGFNRWSQLFCMPYLDFIQRQNYLLAVLGLRQRLYFVKISAETIQISRRIKFNSNVQYVSEIGKFPGLVIILHGYEKCKKIILTHQNKLVSYNQPINLEMVDYYSIEQQVQTNQNCRNRLYKRIDLYKQKEIHFINTSGIQRIVISKWQDIYNQMKETQNIKLLKVLILLKHVQSPFLKSPSSFQMLQSFFPTYNSLTKQILLEYYQIMNLTPQKINIIQNPTLIIPFILQHKIRNLPEELQNKIMQWCLEKDERLVQEMIIGGSECGWQFAIKRGWIRAFKAMVRSGMQIEMPILKLYSMALLQRKKIVNQATQEETQILSAQGHSFLNQLIQYVIFVFTYCLTDLQGEENIIELKQIVSLVFKNQLWTFLVKFQPLPSITLLTHLFAKQNCIQHINHSFELQDITGFNKIFRPLLKTNYSNAETIFSHLSCIFNELHPQMVLQMIKQHSKFMLLKYHYLKENPLPSHSDFNVDTITLIYQILNNRHFQKLGVFDLLRRYRKKYEIQYYFSFKKEYLKQMLKMLIRDSSILDNMYRDLSTIKLTHLLELSEEQIEEDMNDFLVFIWIEIYILILESLQRKQPEEIRKYSKEEIVGFLSEIQEQNYKLQYLGLHIMQSINYMNQDYSLKIFQKYFKCNNQLLKSRIFFWLNKTLYSLPVNSNTRINLQEQIIRKLKDLIEIDKEESRMILQSFFQDRQKEIIKKIDNNPALQLEYVQLIINKGRDGQHIQNYYTNLHIKLILQLKPQNLIDIFNKNSEFADYNIADALAMTQASDNFDQKLDILIFLYEKDGQITKCIDTYLQKLQELALSFIKNLQKHKEIDNLFEQLDESINLSFNEYLSTYLPQLNQIILYFTTKFQQSIKLIYRQVQVKYEFIKIYLNKLVQILVYILSENFKFKNDYIKFISSSIGNFIFKMRENNCLHFLSQWLRDYPGRFQFFTHVQPYFIQVFNKVQIQTIVTNKVSDIQRKTLVKQIKETLKLMEFSITSVGICPVCQQPLNLQSITVEALLFGCGHIYHKTCIQPIGGQDFCFFCVSKNQYKSMIQNPKLDLVQLLKSYRQMRRRMSSPHLNLEIKLKDTLDGLNKKKMNRLGLFDKKVSTIQSQAEIIDLKLLIEQYYANQNKK